MDNPPPPPPTRSYFDALTSGNGPGVVRWGRWFPSEQHATMLGPPSVTDALTMQDRIREMKAENDVMTLLYKSRVLKMGHPDASSGCEHAAKSLFVHCVANQKFTPNQILRIARALEA